MDFEFLSTQFLDNKISDYFIALVILVAGMLTIKIFRNIALNRLKKWAARTDNIYDNAIVRIIEHNLIPIAYIGIIYLAISNLTLHPILARAIEVLFIMASTLFAIRLFTTSGEYLIRIYWVNSHRNNVNIEQSIDALVPAIRIFVWLIGIVFLLDNLGFDISAVVASLGIGGVAIALASQGVL